MKLSTITLVLALLLSSFLITGFQCGSAEITSARLYIQRSDWENAERSLVKEVQKNPNNAEAWYLLGYSRAQMGNYAGMLEAFDSSLKVSNEFAPKIDLTKKFAWGQSLNRAVTTFNKSINAPKDSVGPLRDSSIAEYQLALKINPDSVITYKNLAIALQSVERYDDEIATLKQGESHRKSPDIDTLLINAYLFKIDDTRKKAMDAEAMKDTAKGIEYYNSAIATVTDARTLYPDDPELLSAMIDMYVGAHRAADAKPFLYEAIAKDPSNKVYQYNMGVLLMQTDSLAPAISHFEAALKSDPGYDVALQNVAVAEMRLGDEIKKANQDASGAAAKAHIDHFKKAADYFQRLINLNQTNKENPTFWDYLASAYANADMVAKAKEALKQADDLRKK